jgi:hypothetical protein
MSLSDPVIPSEAAMRQIRRMADRDRATMTNLRSRLATFSVRRHQGGYMPPYEEHVQVWQFTGSPTVGDVMAGNADNIFTGRVKRFVNGSVASVYNCWIGFVDWYDADTSQTLYALHGKYYYAKLSGSATSAGVTAPFYVATQGNFECWCKADSAIAKGASGTVSLYNDDFTDSTLNRASTLAKFMDVDTTQWCMLTRTMGTYIVQPVECPA